MLPLLMGAGIAGSIYGAHEQSNAIRDAAAASERAAREALDYQRQADMQRRADMSPWLTAGRESLSNYTRLMNDPNAYQQSPYNAWLQQQGAQGIERSAAARGSLNSGNVLAELAKYNQNVAGAGLGDQLNRLGVMSGQGSNAANGLASAGQQSASNMGNIAMSNASNIGNAGMAGASNTAGLINNLTSLGMQGYGMYQGKNSLNDLVTPSGTRYMYPQSFGGYNSLTSQLG